MKTSPKFGGVISIEGEIKHGSINTEVGDTDRLI